MSFGTYAAITPAARHVVVEHAMRRLPRHVSLMERDKALPLDLDNVLCADLLAAETAESGTAMLVEQFPSPERLGATSPEGHFVHQLLLPFRYDQQAAGAPITKSSPRKEGSPRRVFSPASEWLYLKVYGMPRSLDRILLEVMEPAVRDLIAAGVAGIFIAVKTEARGKCSSGAAAPGRRSDQPRAAALPVSARRSEHIAPFIALQRPLDGTCR